jgi:hypothetical protein
MRSVLCTSTIRHPLRVARPGVVIVVLVIVLTRQMTAEQLAAMAVLLSAFASAALKLNHMFHGPFLRLEYRDRRVASPLSPR